MTPAASAEFWHARYTQQAAWTASLREYLIRQANPGPRACLLEVGCGTGAVLADLAARFPDLSLFGVDIDEAVTAFARQRSRSGCLCCADGLRLPFPPACFDVVICHYLLLWIDQPLHMLSEMRRVTRPGGMVIAMAEPDHAARLDYPPPLDELGRLQQAALTRQGARLTIGRELAGLFHAAGLRDVTSGILGAEWQAGAESGAELEWQTLAADLAGTLTSDQLSGYAQIAEEARSNGTRILFIPTFFAWGKV